MIVGIGIDIVELERLAKVLQRHPETFPARVFTDAERQAAGSRQDPTAFYAGRWAAKEAVAKALGVGFGKHCQWTDIEITADQRGAPMVTLNGQGKRTAVAAGIGAIKVSISHEQHYACAMAIAEAGQHDGQQ